MSYASDRVLFGKPIGANQGIQFPIAQAYAQIEAADLMRFQAAAKFDRHEKCGAEANMAKLLASEAAWEAANICLTTHGGYGFAREYDVERKFRETRLLTIAPVSNNLILAFIGNKVLGLPKSLLKSGNSGNLNMAKNCAGRGCLCRATVRRWSTRRSACLRSMP